MARFRLMERDAAGNKVGCHFMGKVVRGVFTTVVKPGQIVESDEPLDQLFRNKFQRLDDGPKPEPEAEPSETPKRSRK